MLDEKDLQAIQAMIDRAEERTAQKTVFMMESNFNLDLTCCRKINDPF